MSITVYTQQNERAIRVCNAMVDGMRARGSASTLTQLKVDSCEAEKSDWTVFYGQANGGRELLDACVEEGKNVLYIDLGYWKRKTSRDQYAGYHKIAWNNVHPSKQLEFKVDNDRFNSLGITLLKQRKKEGRNILLAGLSEKAAIVNGLQPYEWERKMIAQIREHTDRPIVYRPKPSWKKARPLEGAIFSSRLTPVENVLQDTHCVVTRHSNVSIDAMAVGIPAYAEFGAARGVCYGIDKLNLIDTIKCPSYDDRYELLCKLAYCQWSIDEMRNGKAWNWFRSNIGE